MNNDKLEIPTWVKVVGIIAIVWGIVGLWVAEYCCGLGETAEMEKLVKMKLLFRSTPAWFRSWSVVIGLLGLLVNACFIYAGFALLQIKRFAIRLFYITVALSMGYAVLRQVILSKVVASSLVNIVLGVTIAGVLINIVLLIFVCYGDQEVFSREAPADVGGASE